jgi:hypothetical protein
MLKRMAVILSDRVQKEKQERPVCDPYNGDQQEMDSKKKEPTAPFVAQSVNSLQRFQSGIGRHQPLGADLVELDLHPLAELDAAGVKAQLHLVLAKAAKKVGVPDFFASS